MLVGHRRSLAHQASLPIGGKCPLKGLSYPIPCPRSVATVVGEVLLPRNRGMVDTSEPPRFSVSPNFVLTRVFFSLILRSHTTNFAGQALAGFPLNPTR